MVPWFQVQEATQQTNVSRVRDILSTTVGEMILGANSEIFKITWILFNNKTTPLHLPVGPDYFKDTLGSSSRIYL